MTVKNGDMVKIEYTGTLDDGTEFDSSKKHGKPLEVKVGEGNLIPGFEKALIGMKKDEEKEIVLKPEEAYGPVREEMVKTVPRDQIPPEAKEGSTLAIKTPQGPLPLKVTKLTDKEATLDMNHPLAGKTLHFKIKVVEIASE